MHNITAKSARYIKLGEGGKWDDQCFRDGTIRLAFYEASHEDALSGNMAGLLAAFADRPPQVRSNFARQVLAFYREPEDTIWITFSGGYLHWCQAQEGVEFLGQDKVRYPDGSRLRRTRNGWHKADINGRPLRVGDIPGSIAKTAGFRSTLCAIAELDTLLRLINGEERPATLFAKARRDEAVESLIPLIQLLSPQDLELLTELIFAQSGWRRIGRTGGTQKAVDIELELPVTGEHAFVQVKSATRQSELAEYIQAMDERGDDRLFYVYHTAQKPIATDRRDVTILGPHELAAKAFTAGLFDWIVDKTF